MAGLQGKILLAQLLTDYSLEFDVTHTISPYRWPAEWEPQTATWLSWPHRVSTWPGHFGPIPPVYVRWIEVLTKWQHVHLIAGSPHFMREVQEAVGHLKNLTIHPWRTNDIWIRDYGPTFVERIRDGKMVAVDWQFNAWGNKYPDFEDDAGVAEKICHNLGCLRSRSPIYCEGGGLETDGQGTLLTTSSCLLSPQRNPGWTREMIEAELRQQLGAGQIVWVDGGGLEGDDTDGHIDQLARFVAPGVVVAAVSSSSGDSNRQGLLKNVETLRQSRTSEGKPLAVHPLPTPAPRLVGNQRVPESYCNFLFVNGAVIVPTFRSPSTDQTALQLLTQLIPDRRIIPLDAYDLILGRGAFHCASQQQPS